MGRNDDLILPLTIGWGSNPIRHRISNVAVSPNAEYFVTGSWDGNLFIWSLTVQGSPTLSPRWVVTGETSAVLAIACFNKYFVTCHNDGSICHYELPNGRHVKRIVDDNHIHTSAVPLPLEDCQVMCAGYYPDIIIIDAFKLTKTMILSSREHADWISCFRSFSKENGIQVQGITTGGFLKTWSLNDADNGVCLESSLGPLGVRHCKAMSFNMSRRWLLLVSTSQIIVFDVGINVVFKHTAIEAIEGGDFLEDNIIFWTKHGDVYECNIKSKIVNKILEMKGSELHVPANRLLLINKVCYLVAADINGTLSMWKLELNSNIQPHRFAFGDSACFNQNNDNLISHLGLIIVCSIHIPHLNKFIAGCNNGKLLIFPASELILSYFISSEKPDFCPLSGHSGAVRCILYPHAEEKSYEENVLVSGGDDFSVCLWDIFQRVLLHKFCIHSGPVVRLLTPPSECSSRVASAICSVSVDHSVAILSLRDRKCAFLASQHPFPIVTLRWKPCHDFLIVKCFDGSVFVWELRTGVLDRVVTGVAAEEVVYDCDQANEEILWDFYTAAPTNDELPRQLLHVSQIRESEPVHITGFLINPHMEAHILFLNISELCSHLKTIFPNSDNEPDTFRRINSLAKPPNPVGIHKTINNVLDALKHEAENLQDKFHLSILPKNNIEKGSMERKVSAVSGTQLIPYAQLALSLLHVWSKNREIDQICIEQLGLIQPKFFGSFDLISAIGSLSLQTSIFQDNKRTRQDLISATALSRVFDKFSFSIANSDENTTAWDVFIKNAATMVFPVDALSCETLAALWQTKSSNVRKVIHDILPKLIQSLEANVLDSIYKKWRIFLPSVSSSDDDHLSIIAVIITSLLTIDSKLRCKNFDNVKEVSESLRFIVTNSNLCPSVVSAAIDMVGRGFLLWELILPVDDTLVSIFERCIEFSENDITLTGRKALNSIANERISQVIAHLKFMCKTSHPILENAKVEILSLIREILVEMPKGLITLLSDVVEILLACIDSGHLKEAELSALLGIWLPQLHHNVAGQRVAVGMPDGKIVVHDVRAKKSHVFPAHDGSIAAVRFSPDGKNLVAVCSSGSASIWQLSHGIFDIGVGQYRFRNVKLFPSVLPNEKLENGVNILWVDFKSIKLEILGVKDAKVVTLSI